MRINGQEVDLTSIRDVLRDAVDSKGDIDEKLEDALIEIAAVEPEADSSGKCPYCGWLSRRPDGKCIAHSPVCPWYQIVQFLNAPSYTRYENVPTEHFDMLDTLDSIIEKSGDPDSWEYILIDRGKFEELVHHTVLYAMTLEKSSEAEKVFDLLQDIIENLSRSGCAEIVEAMLDKVASNNKAIRSWISFGKQLEKRRDKLDQEEAERKAATKKQAAADRKKSNRQKGK